MQINSLDRRFRQVDLENARVINSVWALVDLPVVHGLVSGLDPVK